jgi:hypothetical protein
MDNTILAFILTKLKNTTIIRQISVCRYRGDVLKKQISAFQLIKIVTAVLYGYAALFISLDHTCQPARECGHDRHPTCLSQCSTGGGCSCPSSSNTLNQDALNGYVDFHNGYCHACLHLLSPELTNPRPKARLGIKTNIERFHLLPQTIFVRQCTRLSSPPLRAPPIIPSRIG